MKGFNPTKEQLEKWRQEGKIKTDNPVPVKIQSNAAVKDRKKGAAGKAWMKTTLFYWCQQHGYTFKTEHKFHSTRKWRIDFAILEIKVAIEYEGLMSEKSVHTTVQGFTDNTDKYNAATVEGWRVIRFTALNYKTLYDSLNLLHHYLTCDNKLKHGN